MLVKEPFLLPAYFMAEILVQKISKGCSVKKRMHTSLVLTIEFSYSPTALGNTNVLYPITSNDPDFDGITLSGNCYEIVQAIEKTIYASSGTQNNGEILTINPNTGEGLLIGPSLFSEVKGLAINPLNGIIYGLVAVSGGSEIIRVNSESGDAYSLFQLNIPSPADIAFDTLGTLYGIGVNGETYTIDLSSGNITFKVDAIGSYSGITFHPQTNELWATPRAFIPPNKDAVFKINLSNGDTTIIGHTGLNKLTNDLIFDENLNLYEVIGSSAELNNFISIDSETGVGTVVGSVGMKHILGMTYIDQIISRVEDDKNSGSIPSDYALRQNYFPRLRFHWDPTFEKPDRIERLIASLHSQEGQADQVANPPR